MTDFKFQKEITAIIKDGDAKTLVATAEKIAREMVHFKKDKNEVDDKTSVSTSQIRNIFGTSKKLQMQMDSQDIQKIYSYLILLKPKMAYANGRHNKKKNKPGFKLIVDCLSYAIDLVDGQKYRMENFFNFFEAILAYHKAEGGK